MQGQGEKDKIGGLVMEKQRGLGAKEGKFWSGAGAKK